MINVDRNCVESPVIKSKHRTEDILEALSVIFLDKCYLCESKQSKKGIYQIDHLKPTTTYTELRHEWNNLYLCCEGCNNFKRANKKEILDPCYDNVEELIIYEYEYSPEKEKYVPSFLSTDINNEKINNTVELLEKLHNRETGESTYRAESLQDTIHKRWSLLMEACVKLQNAQDDLTKQKETRKIKTIISRSAPFTMLMRYTAKKYHFDKKIPNLFD